MHQRVLPILLSLTALLTLSACGSNSTKTASTSSSSSRQELAPSPARPSAPLGLYVSYYLGGGGIPPPTSAIQGVDTEVKLHAQYNPLGNNDTFALLQEYGNILQINIPDLLNRSSDRPTTLTEYTTALTNITARAQQTNTDLTDYQKTLSTQQSDQAAQVKDMQSRIDTAYKAGDFATAGSLQQDQSKEQSKLAEIESQLKSAKDTQKSFQSLIDVAQKRLKAIADNREILIAGLKVVNVPGIENLGILESSSSKR